MEKDVEIGIFGGTGIYDSGLLEDAKEVDIDTPYGKPSDTITVGTFKRSEEHTSEPSHTVISYAVFCLKKKKKH